MTLERQQDARLERLARATDDLAPPEGFEDRVMVAVYRAPQPRAWLGRLALLGCFAAAAGTAVLVSRTEQRQLDTKTLSVLDGLEDTP
ncbi:MAG: hypothetical protein KIT72_19065 [Polyangiaceae bacterium]|nr:hypothetical protein [Polyangiaceae bacterium]MCW5792522.1 hypothetical protein [Polyangiaceae bacterium]